MAAKLSFRLITFASTQPWEVRFLGSVALFHTKVSHANKVEKKEKAITVL